MTLFTKPATSIETQIRLLGERGMIIDDIEDAKRWLQTVSYYRLSSYWLPSEVPAQKGQKRSRIFQKDVNFQSITNLYVLDRRLRLLVMEAIDRIEIAVRTQWTLKMVGAFGPHAHCNSILFKNSRYYKQSCKILRNQIEKSGELFIQHYNNKYTSPQFPPLWMATELMSLGDLSKWIDNTKPVSKIKFVGRAIGLPSANTLITVLQVLVIVRNHCAHHGRLWNRKFLKRPEVILTFKPDLHVLPSGQLDNRIYNILVILTRLLEHQSPETSFLERLQNLINNFSDSQRKDMGFPHAWKDYILGRPQ